MTDENDNVNSEVVDAAARRAARRVSTSGGSLGEGRSQMAARSALTPHISDTSVHGGSVVATDSKKVPVEENSPTGELVGESLVRAAPIGSELVIPPHATITPLARELAFTRGVRFVTGRYAEPLGPANGSAAERPRGAAPRRALRVAVASDHGGFALKAELVDLLRELGHRAVDLGPLAATPSVDYPEFARKVAEEVSHGRADVGIVVDGAGIGSAMVANKFPGVLAANCWDVRTARNAREHNHANVLTLGSSHLDLGAARAVIAAFLETPVGEGRHARRNKLTRELEAENLKQRRLERAYDDER